MEDQIVVITAFVFRKFLGNAIIHANKIIAKTKHMIFTTVCISCTIYLVTIFFVRKFADGLEKTIMKFAKLLKLLDNEFDIEFDSVESSTHCIISISMCNFKLISRL